MFQNATTFPFALGNKFIAGVAARVAARVAASARVVVDRRRHHAGCVVTSTFAATPIVNESDSNDYQKTHEKLSRCELLHESFDNIFYGSFAHFFYTCKKFKKFKKFKNIKNIKKI